MTSMPNAREIIYIVLIDVFLVFVIFLEDIALLFFPVCVEKMRQIKCFVLQCCT
jgi:hypothetical protein